MFDRLKIVEVLRDDRGATAIEYGLIVALLVIAILGALDGFAGAVIDLYGYVDTTVADNIGTSS
jgi:pilus assembly protein Flp/PilA